ncbi:STAS domain-containing protein [Streptomyces sp. NPDC049967]|uniref:STAS domain-containing protein n=1 Tax=Streptomyces sp. NPDC049967 TaxID=3155658 RepID=UPI003431B8E7
MNTPPPAHLRLTTVDTRDRLRIELHGDLDFDNAGVLLQEVTTQLSARPGLKDLHLHCGGLGSVDSTGLSTLLMIVRRTSAAGVRLHLDDRTAGLDRILVITGTLDYLTTPLSNGVAKPSVSEENVGAARPTGPDGTT